MNSTQGANVGSHTYPEQLIHNSNRAITQRLKAAALQNNNNAAETETCNPYIPHTHSQLSYHTRAHEHGALLSRRVASVGMCVFECSLSSLICSRCLCVCVCLSNFHSN